SCCCRATRKRSSTSAARLGGGLLRPRRGLARRGLRAGLLGQRVDPLLERRHALLEALDAADALLQLVDAVARRVHGFDHVLAARRLRETLDRLLTGIREPRQEILLRGHRREPYPTRVTT